VEKCLAAYIRAHSDAFRHLYAAKTPRRKKMPARSSDEVRTQSRKLDRSRSSSYRTGRRSRLPLVVLARSCRCFCHIGPTHLRADCKPCTPRSNWPKGLRPTAGPPVDFGTLWSKPWLPPVPRWT
jgi:hypothetical protein